MLLSPNKFEFQDEDAERTATDELNGFPAMKLTLNAGGCAFYEFPIQPGEKHAFIVPAKKRRPGVHYPV